MTLVVHHFTVDVEEYFQVSAFERSVSRESWDTRNSRVQVGVERLLALLDTHGATGTFFTLGWVAARHPHVVRAIADAGHEVASHGWGHRRVTNLTEKEFKESVRRSKETLEDVVGSAVVGYRAPSFSIVRGREWALDVLLEEGYRYDSSLFPVRRRGYGYGGGRREPHELARSGGKLLEIPPTTLAVMGLNVPAAGGAYLRLFPLALVRTAFRAAEGAGTPGTFYVHPWEVDPEQPRLEVPWTTRLRHYGGLQRTAARIDCLLTEFRFASIASRMGELVV